MPARAAAGVLRCCALSEAGSRGPPRWRVRRRTARLALRAGPRRGPLSLLAAVRTSWRRSLQLRVVATTVLLGMAAVTLLGAYLAGQISDRLFVERREQVLAEADQALTDVQELLAGASVGNRDEVETFVLDQVLTGLEGVNADRERGVLLLRPPGTEGARLLPDLVSGGMSTAVVPPALRAAVRAGDRADTPVRLGGPGGATPGLAVGDLVDVPIVGEYELYLVFSLEREQRTLDAVQRVLVVGGVALVLLVGAVAWVVTRQVVAPVRQAAGVAARLADGDLDQRMQRRGQDDLARLAGSFNAMAASLQDQIGRMEELSRLQQRFVSDVSHELRTPLTTIRMAGEVLHESAALVRPRRRPLRGAARGAARPVRGAARGPAGDQPVRRRGRCPGRRGRRRPLPRAAGA